ncbi:hypothetical protein EC988_001637 [Linderina pennispora]|nr:hypothetical protein EC988_001637 [Linderina pennispora]
MGTILGTRMYSSKHTVAAAKPIERVDPTLPGQSLTFIQKVKGFVSFYKGGLKELLQNNKAAKAIAVKVRNGEDLTRSELQIQRRTPGDKLRLVPFGFLVVIIPELIPLTIWLFPGVCPSTCVTFGQTVKMGRKQDVVRQRLHAQAVQRIAEAGIKPGDLAVASKLGKLDHEIFQFETLADQDVQLIARYMGVRGGLFANATALKTKLRLELDYLHHDDQLLANESLVGVLGLTELHRACQERGIPTADYPEQQLRNSLDAWTKVSQAAKGGSDMLPIVWSRLALFNKAIKV